MKPPAALRDSRLDPLWAALFATLAALVFLALLPALLVPGKSPVWFQLVSHKLLRLVCPFALTVVFVTSLALAFAPSQTPFELVFYRTLALGQLAFYGLAALGSRAGRLGTLARTFVVLNAAALVGLVRYLRGKQAVTW